MNCSNCGKEFDGNFCPNCGARSQTAYFDNKEEAYDCYHAQTHVDKPVAIVVKKQETIDSYNELVRLHRDYETTGSF